MDNWQEQFDNQPFAVVMDVVQRNYIKIFIQSLLDQRDKEHGKFVDNLGNVWAERLISELTQQMEALTLKRKDKERRIVEDPDPVEITIRNPFIDGYNQAVSDLEELKKNL